MGGDPVLEDAPLLLRLDDLGVTFRLLERCWRDAALDVLLGFFLDVLLLPVVFVFDDGFFDALLFLDAVVFPFLGVVFDAFFDFFLLSFDCFVELPVDVALGVVFLLFEVFPLLFFVKVTIVLTFGEDTSFAATLVAVALALNVLEVDTNPIKLCTNSFMTLSLVSDLAESCCN